MSCFRIPEQLLGHLLLILHRLNSKFNTKVWRIKEWFIYIYLFIYYNLQFHRRNQSTVLQQQVYIRKTNAVQSLSQEQKNRREGKSCLCYYIYVSRK
jgi:hypothetical protein